MSFSSFSEGNDLLRNEFDDRKNSVDPSTLGRSSTQKVWWKCSRGHSWEATVRARTSAGQGCPFCSRKRAWPGETDFLTEEPRLKEYWHQDLNPEINPLTLTSGSHKKLRWRCPNGHVFEKAVYSMKNHGCKYCSNNQLLVGFNDLQTKRPDLAKEFDLEKNAPLQPKDFLFGSSKSVWWRCEFGHSFEAKISNRNFTDSKCIYCVGKRVSAGETDFRTKFPKLADSWDYSRNSKSPSEVAVSSQKKVWWKCRYGHSWLMAPAERRYQHCAVCRGYQVAVGFNDLATTSPELVSRIDRSRSPEGIEFKITQASNKLLWWRCESGHSYRRSPANEARAGCGICSGHVVLAGFNDLESQAPDLAVHFDHAKNKTPPHKVYFRSRRPFWWQCKLGHSWKSAPEFLRQGNWCPVCGKKSLLEGFNDLATEFPELVSEWHPTKNGTLLPSDVLGGTHKSLWWLCENGHEFRQTGKKRRIGQGCPSCSRTGFVPAKPAYVYFLEHSEMLSYKVGITSESSPGRLDLFEEAGWVIHRLFWFEKGQQAMDFEKRFFDWLRTEQRVPPFLSSFETKRTGGWTETFSVDSIAYSTVLGELQNLSAEFMGTEKLNRIAN